MIELKKIKLFKENNEFTKNKSIINSLVNFYIKQEKHESKETIFKLAIFIDYELELVSDLYMNNQKYLSTKKILFGSLVTTNTFLNLNHFSSIFIDVYTKNKNEKSIC